MITITRRKRSLKSDISEKEKEATLRCLLLVCVVRHKTAVMEVHIYSNKTYN